MIRIRFELLYRLCNYDYRPAIWIVKWPYWMCGRSEYGYILVAYAENIEMFNEQWPNAIIIKCEEKNEIVFSARFPKPKWYVNIDRRFINGKIVKNGKRPLTKEQLLKNGIDI